MSRSNSFVPSLTASSAQLFSFLSDLVVFQLHLLCTTSLRWTLTHQQMENKNGRKINNNHDLIPVLYPYKWLKFNMFEYKMLPLSPYTNCYEQSCKDGIEKGAFLLDIYAKTCRKCFIITSGYCVNLLKRGYCL